MSAEPHARRPGYRERVAVDGRGLSRQLLQLDQRRRAAVTCEYVRRLCSRLFRSEGERGE